MCYGQVSKSELTGIPVGVCTATLAIDEGPAQRWIT